MPAESERPGLLLAWRCRHASPQGAREASRAPPARAWRARGSGHRGRGRHQRRRCLERRGCRS